MLSLECDYWGVLWLFERTPGVEMDRCLGPVEGARDKVPVRMLGEYEFLLDQHRQGFSPREEAEAAWKIAKGVR